MCLEIDKRVEKQIKAKKQTSITCFKVLTRNFTAIYYGFKYKSGINRSDRSTAKLESLDRKTHTVGNGFHVFINEEDAHKYKKYFAEPIVSNGKWVVVPVQCNMKDFVAAGHVQGVSIAAAVFTKVKILKKDYKGK